MKNAVVMLGPIVGGQAALKEKGINAISKIHQILLIAKMVQLLDDAAK